MFDMNQLQEMLGNQKAHHAQQRMLSLYPIDGQKKAEKVVRHTSSTHILQFIQTNPKSKYLPTIQKIYKGLLDMCVSEEEKAVCAKIISSGDTVAQCMDCRADPSCIICIECFQNSDHKGHRVMFRKGMGGCCDCGDAEAWKEEGFCKKHTGKVQDVQLAAVEIQLANQLLAELFYIYSKAKLTLDKPFVVFKIIMTLFDEMTKRGLKGIKFLYFFFLSQLPKHLTISSKLEGTVIKQLLNGNFISRAEYDQLDNLFIAMFPYYPFKQLLIAEYIACYSDVYAFESTKGMSIACQIMTSYKLIEDYINIKGAKPITIQPTINVKQAHHLTKMLTYDFERIQKCQNDIPIKYWSMQIKNGITGIFGYHQSLKLLARKEKNAAAQKERQIKQKKQKKSKKKKNKSITNNIIENLLNYENNVDQMDVEDDTSFSLMQFLIRNINVVECEYYIFDSILDVLPLLAQNEQIMLQLIRSCFQVLSKEIFSQDDLLIFRPYERLLGIALFFYCKQNPYKLTDPAIRQVIRQAAGVSVQDWEKTLRLIQKRMMQTYGFFSHMQTCETSGYQTSFYTYLIIYSSSKLCLLGHLDILLLKELIIIGATNIVIDFPTVGKIDKLEKPNHWTLRAFSGLFAQLGMLYTGNFSEIYIAYYNEKAEPHAWLFEQSIKALKKFLTEEGGSVNLDKINQFSTYFLFKNEIHLKKALKQICTFNKQKKTFTLLPQHIDKQPINYNDFTLRTQLDNKNKSELLPPQFTLQLIDKSNKIIFSAIWNETNIRSFCQIILELYDEVQKNKSKDQLIQFYAMPCKLEFLLNAINVDKTIYSNLNEILFNFDVSPEIRKGLGKLANSLSPYLEQQLSSNSSNDGSKEDMKTKKMKKLEELKKKKNENLLKLKQMHEILPQQTQNIQDQCVICRKSGGNLVWVAKMSIRNFQKLLGVGKGTLALSFTSCYHTFDEECIIKNAIKRSTHDYLFRCPVCRTLGNVFFNLNGEFQSSFDRILHVAMTMRQYASFDRLEEIFKSFYHYVLLGYLQPAYLTQKRLKLYQQILKNLKNEKLRPEILEIKEKLQNHKIVLEPKMLANKQKINLKEVQIYEEEFLSDEDMFEDEDEEQMRIFEHFLQNQRLSQLERKEGKRKKALQKLESKQNKKQYINKQTPVFYYTIKRIINHILKEKGIEHKMEKKIAKQQKIISQDEQEQANTVNTKLNKLQLYEPEPWLESIIDQLLDQKKLLEAQWMPPKLIKLIDLPERYYWDMTDGACDACKSVCQDIFLCLLCKWKGCLNTCKKQGIKGHIKKSHGQSGAFLRLRDANAYLLGPGQLFKIGCMYTNEWGEQFNQQKDWNSYYLQTQICDKVIGMILKNE